VTSGGGRCFGQIDAAVADAAQLVHRVAIESAVAHAAARHPQLRIVVFDERRELMALASGPGSDSLRCEPQILAIGLAQICVLAWRVARGTVRDAGHSLILLRWLWDGGRLRSTTALPGSWSPPARGPAR
jgi:hypothetical protein